MASEPVDSFKALLINGTVGVGKSTTADAVGQLLESRRIPHAVIDLDQLRRSWPAPDGDRFNAATELRNLRSIAANYRDIGAQRVVLAGVAESRADVARYEESVNGPLAVVRLRADPAILQARLRERHRLDPDGLAWHLARAIELDEILDQAGSNDRVVQIEDHGPMAVAQDVLKAAAW